jgi:hypothetical protein
LAVPPKALSQSPSNEISGAFGFTLGQPVPAEFHLSSPVAGGNVYFTPQEPFRIGWVSVDRDGLVYEIYGTAHKADYSQLFDELKAATRKTLTEKYGLARASRLSKGETELVFGDEQRTVNMYDSEELFWLQYTDRSLEKKDWDRRKREKNAAVVKAASALSKQL